MTRKNSRYTKRDGSIDPYANLVADIIIDAFNIASGQSAATDWECSQEAEWLRGETCQRWALTIGVDIDWAINHKDSILRKE